jgi:hypothetical protein
MGNHCDRKILLHRYVNRNQDEEWAPKHALKIEKTANIKEIKSQ